MYKICNYIHTTITLQILAIDKAEMKVQNIM